MFTGIIKGVFQVNEVLRKAAFQTLEIQLNETLCAGLETGASVAVNGVCLTVTAISVDSCVRFDVMQETLRVTNLGELEAGSWVNIERAARFGDDIGGHLLSGHIHDMAEVAEVIKTENNTTVVLKFPPRWKDYIQPKGYIAINGASLTIGDEVSEDTFCVHLIPETLKMTTFGRVQAGDHYNIEIDSQTQAVVNTVKSYLARKA